MFQRIAYGALAIAILVSLVIADTIAAELASAWDHPVGRLIQRGSILPLILTVLMCWSAVELNRMLARIGAAPDRQVALIGVAALMLAPWLSAAGWLGKGAMHVEGLFWLVFVLAAISLTVVLRTVVAGSTRGAMRDSSATMLVVLYLGFLGSFAMQIRCGRDTPAQTGAWVLLVTILIIKSSDIGAYFAGSFFGRHKLVPAISPAKTVEGAIGGLLGSALVAVLMVYLASKVALDAEDTVPSNGSRLILLVIDAARAFGFDHTSGGLPPMARAFVFGLIMSCAGQIGDLFESCFKRDADIKDSGRVMPRFGGILDLVDSPVLALPVAWFLLAEVWHII